LINQYRVATPERPAMSLNDAIMHGARQRLRPILMTALATIFALIPMGLGLTGQSGFISQPLAVVVIGGLVSSTLLTLVLVPVLYRLVESGKEKRATRRANHKHSAQQGTDAADLAVAMDTASAKIATPAAAAPAARAASKEPETTVRNPKPNAGPGASVVHPFTGQIPTTRKERRAIEEMINKSAKDSAEDS